jgi:hypothetical protein
VDSVLEDEKVNDWKSRETPRVSALKTEITALRARVRELEAQLLASRDALQGIIEREIKKNETVK